MAVAGTDPTPTKHPRAREEREHPRKSAAEHVRQASAEIDKARREATADVRRSLDTALEPMRDGSGAPCQRAEHQTAERQDASEHTSDTARRQMRRPGIRAQRTPEALEGLPDEIRKQKTELGPPAPTGCVEYRIHSAADAPVAVLPESVRPVGRVEARWPRSTSWS